MMTTKKIYSALIIALMISFSAQAQKKKKGSTPEKGIVSTTSYGGLKFRSIGPAITSGRIADFAVNPNNHSEYYVASASGGVWKTTNAGTTYSPIFDGQGSYSIGCVTIDPSNTNIIWVGTGENNSQRSVAYGDGVYKSEDGGKSWKNVGLKQSEHIGKILVDPRNSNVVYVAAYGPLWSAGGDRGLYKTTDGGKNWEAILTIDEHTGMSEIAFDPRNPDVIYAASHQRRRHVFTYISGGPGSKLQKSKDGGKTWEVVGNGFPSGDLGRIGIGVSPANPDYVYAIVEADSKKKGFYRSTDRGASWSKMNSYSTSGNYYQELVCDPKNKDRVYSMATWGQVTHNGGRSFQPTGETNKHVDNHCLWIDPNNTDHLLNGNDGGVYESFDRAKTWSFKANLPVTQFYKVALDNDTPFYNVYGGTQDNFSLGGPSRTLNQGGIVNSDWIVTNGGDGFESQADPVDANIVYAQAQYGWLVRYDKKSGESIGIQPQPGKGEPGFRWNWDAPLLISPHNHKRLYFAANKVFRSDDRGDTWKAISGDLTRQIDRNKLPVMGKVWSMDAVAKNVSTTIYGNIVALDESPKKEGLVYIGTDDGLIQITEDNGGNWRKLSKFTGVPEKTYVNMIVASQHTEGTVYAAFNNHKNGDFKPYLLKSTDKGNTWTSIAANLPERGSVYSIAEDHVDPNLLFVGTEFGVFFTSNGGKNWVQLKAGLPTVAIRDIAIQRRENDLVLASFGRGFYVLDDYTPLRNLKAETLEKDAHIFPIKDGLMYIESRPLGIRGKAFQGASFYTAKNPPVGAVFTWYKKEGIKTLKEQRQAREKEAEEKGEAIAYPSFEEIRTEDNEEKPYLLFTVKDASGNVVRRLKTGARKGVNRIVWDFRYPTTSPARLTPGDYSNPFSEPDVGHLALPGKYTVSIAQSVNGKITELAGPTSFNCVPLNNATLGAKDKAAVLAFQKDVAELSRAVDGVASYKNELDRKLKLIKVAVREAPKASLDLLNSIKEIEQRSTKLGIQLYGDGSISSRQFETAPALAGRVGNIIYNLWSSSSAPTQTMKDGFAIAGEELSAALTELRSMTDAVVKVEQQLENSAAPWTPGRFPEWKK
jgi:photosystem II stability/assembly factor-like uncharacterized protein